MAALGWRRPLNMGSIVSTSGSVKYVVGAPPGPKSRGGVVMTLGGAMGPGAGACARARWGATAAAPATPPMALMSERREMRVASGSMGTPPGKEVSCARMLPRLQLDLIAVGIANVQRRSGAEGATPFHDLAVDGHAARQQLLAHSRQVVALDGQ